MSFIQINKFRQKLILVCVFFIIIIVFFNYKKNGSDIKSELTIVGNDVFSPYSACLFVNDSLLLSSSGSVLYFIDTEFFSVSNEIKLDRDIFNISLSNDKRKACLACSGKLVILNLETFEFYDKPIFGRLVERPFFTNNNDLFYVTVIDTVSKLNKFNCVTKKNKTEDCPFVTTYPFFFTILENKIVMLAKKTCYVFDSVTLEKKLYITDEKISAPCMASGYENDLLLISTVKWFKIYDIKTGSSVAEGIIPKNEYIHKQSFLKNKAFVCLNLNSGFGRPSTLLFYKLINNSFYAFKSSNSFQRFSFSISPNEEIFAESGFLNGRNIISVFKTNDILLKSKKI